MLQRHASCLTVTAILLVSQPTTALATCQGVFLDPAQTSAAAANERLGFLGKRASRKLIDHMREQYTDYLVTSGFTEPFIRSEIVEGLLRLTQLTFPKRRAILGPDGIVVGVVNYLFELPERFKNWILGRAGFDMDYFGPLNEFVSRMRTQDPQAFLRAIDNYLSVFSRIMKGKLTASGVLVEYGLIDSAQRLKQLESAGWKFKFGNRTIAIGGKADTARIDHKKQTVYVEMDPSSAFPRDLVMAVHQIIVEREMSARILEVRAAFEGIYEKSPFETRNGEAEWVVGLFLPLSGIGSEPPPPESVQRKQWSERIKSEMDQAWGITRRSLQWNIAARRSNADTAALAGDILDVQYGLMEPPIYSQPKLMKLIADSDSLDAFVYEGR